MSPLSSDEVSRTRFASRWIRLGDPPPDALGPARLQLHRAAQLLSAFGQSFVPHRPDDSHAAMTWSPERRAFLSEPTVEGSSIRLGLHPGELAYRLFEPSTHSEPFRLEGRTLSDAVDWLVDQLATRIGEAASTFSAPSNDLPSLEAVRGRTFEVVPAELSELERWFHDASLLLEAVATGEEGSSPVRCWPHHFDIAVLIDLDAGAEPPPGPDEARSIGIGMTPGDDDYPEPYLYVTPWPYPETDDLPNLPPPARWHGAGWLGAVLTGPDLVAAGDGEAQATRASSFARAAVAGCRALLRSARGG